MCIRDSLSCLSALYPLFLVVLTWICVELHGHNFRPLVLLWRPFHRCFVRLRKGWDTRNDIIDVFSTFLLLAYNKLAYKSVQLLGSQYVIKNGKPYAEVNLYDPSITYLSGKHLPFIIVSLVILLVFVISPPFFLLLYPTKVFSTCLVKCKLNGWPRRILQTFVEKFYGCYKDNYNGVYDRRRFSALYFILRPLVIMIYEFRVLHVSDHMWYFAVVLFASISVLTAFIKPYKKTYMNVIDTLLLAHLALLCLTMSTSFENHLILASSEVILLFVPLFVFLSYHVVNLICKLKRFAVLKICHGCKCCLGRATAYKAYNNFHTCEEHQHLISPTLSINNNIP